ncbi:constitutive coactivator of PPAR-gamma-like protein 2 isoform X2 [Salvelinus sp. IW2-2015]
MVVGQWAGNKPLRGRGGFNMQVVSVGAGRGRGKDIPVKGGRGGKKTSPPPPSTSPPKSSEGEGLNSGGVAQKLNGSPAASAIGQPLDLPPLAQPNPCALASKDNQSEEAPCCLDSCPSDGM